MRRKHVTGKAWRRRVARGNPWIEILDVTFEDDPPDDTVLVAPKAARKSKRQAMIAGLANLREAGIADPD